ncbi:YvdQ family spore coat protein [Dethiobacter alkaliphilus]|uniref:Uncharacterized protein n=1 Tax=Dethiobacter alkaliphilus AHT 1 TaxID=555088 RepID=C0GJY0_DETAL|nr:hypothetical protein [Dethiobacter alkaliphilus]EEG76349.1 hypothetical protein DealDRAFT_2789 [Dethiobacter alkaliphilus AHT 1]
MKIQQNAGLAKDSLKKMCGVSVMEAALVWELLLVSRKFLVFSRQSQIRAQSNEVKAVLEQRVKYLKKQNGCLEEILQNSGLPVPKTYPVDGEKIAFIDEASIIRGLLHQVWERLTGLGYVIRSSVTGLPLRLVAAEFMTEEMQQLEAICAGIKEQCLVK